MSSNVFFMKEFLYKPFGLGVCVQRRSNINPSKGGVSTVSSQNAQGSGRKAGPKKMKAWQQLADSKTSKGQIFHGKSAFLLRRRLIMAKNVRRNIVFHRWFGCRQYLISVFRVMSSFRDSSIE